MALRYLAGASFPLPTKMLISVLLIVTGTAMPGAQRPAVRLANVVTASLCDDALASPGRTDPSWEQQENLHQTKVKTIGHPVERSASYTCPVAHRAMHRADVCAAGLLVSARA